MKLGFANGVFDGLHAGHRFFLQKAREHCNWLIVAINTDESVRSLKGEGRPIRPLETRLRMLQLSGLANTLVPFEGDPVPLIKIFHPDVLIRGSDQSSEGAEYARAVVQLPRLEGFSTTGMLHETH